MNTISVDLKAADHDLLEEAIKALGLNVRRAGNTLYVDTPQGRITINNGKAEFTNSGCQAWVNKIKQAYSYKTVERIAKKYKFTMTTKGDNKIVLRRY